MSEYGEDQALADKVISESRDVFRDRGFQFLLWGFIVVIGTLITYFCRFTGHYKLIDRIWIVLYSVGMICSFIFGWRLRMKESVKSFVGRIYTAIWIGIAIEIGILFFLYSLAGAFSLVVFLAFLSALLGIGYFTSGLIARFKWMIILSAGWWIGSVAIIFADPKWSAAILGITVLLFQLIPGIIFYFFTHEVK
ncbi:MAG TPA: hypothetical protein VF857_05810 [Spirochaetota bacterium]